MSSQLNREAALQLLKEYNESESLLNHGLAVSGVMAHFSELEGEKKEYWEIVGLLHDLDYEKYPDEHCHHVRELLAPEGIDEADIAAIISHGYGITTEETAPATDMEKSLFTVDELTGIVQAYALMRPEGLDGMTVKSLKKKFKDKHFAAKCNRDIIKKGFDMLGLDGGIVMQCCIDGMQAHKEELGF